VRTPEASLVFSAPGNHRRSVVGAWSANPQHAVIPNGARWHYMASSDALRKLNKERLQALLKPVSHVRIMPGARQRFSVAVDTHEVAERPGKRFSLPPPPQAPPPQGSDRLNLVINHL
jgi:hypothetical protein